MSGKGIRSRIGSAVFAPLASLLLLALVTYVFTLFSFTLLTLAGFEIGSHSGYGKAFLGYAGAFCAILPVIVSVSLLVLIPDLPKPERRILAAIAGIGSILFVVHGIIAIWTKSDIAAHGLDIVFPRYGETILV